MSEIRATRMPDWAKTWWGRLVAVCGGIALVIGAIASGLTIADLSGWLPDKNSGAPPAASPGPVATEAPESSSYQGSWGPDRETFTFKEPASYAVLNSIVDNPVQGDERNFVQVKIAGASVATYSDELLVREGDTLEVNAFVANDAADSLASSSATIHGLQAEILLGSLSETQQTVGIMLSAKNATSVWDGAIVVSRDPVELAYVPGSAVFHTNHGDFDIPDPLGGGSLLGQTGPDGELPVGWNSKEYQGSGYLTFQIRVSPRD
jgi:hypothetical protein